MEQLSSAIVEAVRVHEQAETGRVWIMYTLPWLGLLALLILIAAIYVTATREDK